MFELLGICLTLAALLTFNALASLLTATLWRVLRGRSKNWPSAARAQTLFALRIFPPIIAIVCVGALLLPAYIAHEPRDGVEPVSFKLGALAAISASGLLIALWRGIVAWLATRRLINEWLSRAEPVHFDQIFIPTYRFPHRFPVIAIAGVIRPKLFIADHLFQTLTNEELAAAIAHEKGHLSAGDNLKRALMRACRDSLTILPFGAALDRAWAEASEAAADEFAARAANGVALDLASTLVKIARLAPEGIRPTMPAGALLVGDDAGEIARRVHRLTLLASQTNSSADRRALSAWFRVFYAAFLSSAILLSFNPSALLAIRDIYEMAVAKLQ